MQQGLISVIMPCYNAAPYLDEAVDSVMRQSYTDVELIVIDDGSTDDSVAIQERLSQQQPDRIRLLSQANKGPYHARNLGLQQARGEFIAFLDADDWWSLDCLEKLHSALVGADAMLAYCGWRNVGEGAVNTEPFVPPDYGEIDTTAEFLRTCPWPIHAALVQREVLDAVHGFSARRFTSMDYDLWLRIYAQTQKLVRVPEVMAFYRWHGKGQISSRKWRQVMDALQVRQDFVESNPDKVAHLSPERLRELTLGQVLKEAYRAYWKRDLVNAQALFRRAFTRGAWRTGDLKYILPSWLPTSAFHALVTAVDRKRLS